MGDRLPQLLTVEEAGRLLRVGRTKAYAMATEWRTSGGRSGLPVVDLGHVLRVPLGQLEAMVGMPLGQLEVERPEPEPAPVVTVEPEPVTKPARRVRRNPTAQSQLDLFTIEPKP